MKRIVSILGILTTVTTSIYRSSTAEAYEFGSPIVSHENDRVRDTVHPRLYSSLCFETLETGDRSIVCIDPYSPFSRWADGVPTRVELVHRNQNQGYRAQSTMERVLHWSRNDRGQFLITLESREPSLNGFLIVRTNFLPQAGNDPTYVRSTTHTLISNLPETRGQIIGQPSLQVHSLRLH